MATVGFALVAVAALGGWRLQQQSAEETYAAAARAAAADDGDRAMALLREACGEGSRRACDIENDGGGAGTILH